MKTVYDVGLSVIFMPVIVDYRTVVSVGFFDDMYVPLSYLPQPSAL